jgi:hypothetical protein
MVWLVAECRHSGGWPLRANALAPEPTDASCGAAVAQDRAHGLWEVQALHRLHRRRDLLPLLRECAGPVVAARSAHQSQVVIGSPCLGVCTHCDPIAGCVWDQVQVQKAVMEVDVFDEPVAR